VGRVILHLDMDAFFASVEQADNPALRGLPLLDCLARRAAGEVRLEYLAPLTLAVKVAPC